MANSGGSVIAKHSGNGAYWSFEWTAQATSIRGQTLVSYNIYRRGRTSSPTWLATDCDITVYYNGSSHTVLDTGQRVPGSSDNGTSFYNVKETSGSFIVTHESNGDGSFRVIISAYIDGGYNWEHNCFGDEWCYLDKNYAYTMCSAPTSVSASGIVAPNGNITVSWSGAGGGTSNSISGYDIYWKISSEGSAPTIDTYSGSTSVTTTNSSGSTTINIGSATRGYLVVFGVVTKGEAGSSYYSTIKTGGSVKINSKPTKPSGGNVSPTMIPAAGGTVTFTVFPGSDSDGQTVGLRYSTSTSGARTACASQFSLNLTEAGMYYFWSNDGLEDSDEYITVSVSSNTKPTVTIKVTGTTQQTVNTLNGATYVLNPTITLTQGNNGQQNNNTYNYYIHYSTDNSSWTRKALWEKDSSLTKTIDDVRALGYFTNLDTTGYYYYFSATRYDGMDTSASVTTSSTKYYVSKRPSLKGIFNTQNYENISSSEFQGYFSKALSFTFDRDTGYNSLKIYNGAAQVATIPLTVSTSNLCGQWLGINLPKGSYTFTGEIGYASIPFYTTKMTLGSSYKIENLEAKNLEAQTNFQVYTPNITYDFSIYNTFNVNYSELNASKYKEYGILNISDSFYAKLKINSAEGEKQSLAIAQTTSNGNSTTNDTLYFSLTAAQLYAMLPTTITDKNKTYTAKLIVGFNDVFGTNTETSIDYIVNYGVMPECSNISIKVNGSKEVNTWEYIKESMPLTISGTVKSYNTNPRIQIQINRIKSGVESGYVNFGSPIDLVSKSYSITNDIPGQGKPTTYYFSNQEIVTIGEITELDYQVNFRVKVVTDADSKYYLTGTRLYAGNIKVCGHTSQGAVTLNEADYSSTEATRATSYLNYRYTNNHPGALTITDNSYYTLALTAKLEYRNISNSNWDNVTSIDIGINSLSNFLTNSNVRRSIIFSFPEGADAFVCRLVLTTTQTVVNGTEKYITTKTVYTNEQAVYNVLPTVSYRKNLLGINASNLNNYENAVIVVGEHSSKNIIYLVSSAGVKQINTSTGELDGFMIDGGEW